MDATTYLTISFKQERVRMFLAYICKGPDKGNPVTEFLFILMMVSFQKCFSNILSCIFLQLTSSYHVIQHHIYE